MNLAAWILLGLLLWLVAPITLWAFLLGAVRLYDRWRARRFERELRQVLDR